MSKSAKAASLCFVLIGGIIGLWYSQPWLKVRSAAEPVVALRPPAPGQAQDERSGLITSSAATEVNSRSSVAAAPLAWSSEDATAQVELVTCTGHVVSLPAGERVANVEVRLTAIRNGSVLATTHSDASGNFEFELAPNVAGQVLVRDSQWVSVASNFLNSTTGNDAGTVVVARRGLVAGIVHDPSGLGVVGARCTLSVEDHVFSTLGIEPGGRGGLDDSAGVTTTGENGAFRFDGAPVGEGLVLLVMKEGYQSTSLPLESGPSENLFVELAPLSGENVWWGTVLNAAGEPVEGATVTGGLFLVKSDAKGSFRLVGGKTAMLKGVRANEGHGVLRAALQGYLPAEVTMTPELKSPVILHLGSAALTARGRVVDAAGTPLSGVVVWSPDATLLGLEEKGVNSGIMITMEGVISGMQRNFATTNEAGNFELHGLLDQPYALRAFHPGLLVMSDEVVASPRDAEIVLRLELGEAQVIAGRLVSGTGDPVAGVRVVPMRFPFGVGEEWTKPPVNQGKQEALTDEQGRFKFEALSTRSTTLSFIGRDIKEYNCVKLDQVTDPVNIEVNLGDLASRGARAFYVDLSNQPTLADEMVVLDDKGQPMGFLDRPAQTVIFDKRSFLRIEAGKSPVFSTTTAARTLVLYRGFDEVARISLNLVAGEVKCIVP